MLQDILLMTFYFVKFIYADTGSNVDSEVVKKEDLIYWPNASIPFYIDPDHYDHEQSLSIMTSLSLFSFKTCLKFNPVLVKPTSSQHVMVFENPNGVRKCIFNTEGHSTTEPHRITLGYACLKSPQLEMMVMRGLGFGFEHNRASRDIYIDVQFENIDSGVHSTSTSTSENDISIGDVDKTTVQGGRGVRYNLYKFIHKTDKVRVFLIPPFN